MSDKFYPADETDALLKSASEALQGISDEYAKLAEENNALKAENASLKEASARVQNEKVELQKVASANQGVSDDLATQMANLLADRAIIEFGDREKFASACKNPETMAKVAMEAIRRSAYAVKQGSSVSAGQATPKVDKELQDINDAWWKAASAYERN